MGYLTLLVVVGLLGLTFLFDELKRIRTQAVASGQVMKETLEKIDKAIVITRELRNAQHPAFSQVDLEEKAASVSKWYQEWLDKMADRRKHNDDKPSSDEETRILGHFAVIYYGEQADLDHMIEGNLAVIRGEKTIEQARRDQNNFHSTKEGNRKARVHYGVSDILNAHWPDDPPKACTCTTCLWRAPKV
jgi:hypothetical protein